MHGASSCLVWGVGCEPHSSSGYYAVLPVLPFSFIHSFMQPARGLALLGEIRKSQLELDS